MTKVFVEPIGVTVEIPSGETLLAVVTSGAVDLPVDCAGRGTCGKCLVRIGAGSFSEPNEIERGKVPASKLAPGLAPGLPGDAAVGARQHRGARHPGPPPDPDHLAAAPRRAASGRRARGRGARAAHPGRRARRPRAAARRRWAPDGAAAGRAARAAPDAARRRVSRHRDALRGAPHRRRAGRPPTSTPTAWPSTSAPQRSSPTCSTSRAARRSTRRPSRTPRCALAKTSSRRLTQAIHDGRRDDLREAARGGVNELLARSARARRSTRATSTT